MSSPSPADQLWIPDSSPMFFYSPAEAYFKDMNLASWVGQDGLGGESKVVAGNSSKGETRSWHQTSATAGVILPQIYATSFTPLFYAPEGYNVTFQLDSWDPTPSWTSGQTWDVSDAFRPRTFAIYPDCGQRCGQEPFEFGGGWVATRFSPDGAEVESVTLDDASSHIVYTGFAPVDKDNKIVAVTNDDVEGTLSMTDTQGAQAQIKFTGASIILRGVTCPACGVYTVTIDDSTTATLDSFNNATVHGTILFFATNLDTAAEHTLTLEAQGGVVLDQIEVRGPKGGVGFSGSSNGSVSAPISSSTSTNNGTDSNLPSTNGGSPNAGVIVGAVLGSLAGIAFLWWLCRRVTAKVKKPEDKKLDPWDEANLLQNMKNEEVHVTTAANQRYVYPGLIAHSDLKKK